LPDECSPLCRDRDRPLRRMRPGPPVCLQRLPASLQRPCPACHPRSRL